MSVLLPDGVKIIVGDALGALSVLEDGSVDAIVTSPPYWSLRDYGVEGQIGLEPTLGEYVARLVEVFRECRRVLAPHGTFWLNLGDTYASKTRGSDRGWDKSRLTNPGTVQKAQSASLRGNGERHRGKREGFKPKDLLMVPARVALALQDDGWWLRADVIWSKTNPMPGPWRDRPTSAHEHVFLLAPSSRYWFDTEAVREPPAPRTLRDGRDPESFPGGEGGGNAAEFGHSGRPLPMNGAGRNVRDVWTIATEPNPDAHFATMPSELARRCIRAGAARWVCRECGKPRDRIVERTRLLDGEPLPEDHERSFASPDQPYRVGANGVAHTRYSTEVEALGWTDCGHGAYRPGVVLDPFLGSGTTAVAALREQRHAIGIELNPDYVALAEERIANWHRKPPRPPAALDEQPTLLELA